MRIKNFEYPPWQRNSNVLNLHFIRSIVRSVFRLHFWLYRFPSINQNVYSFNISFRSFHRFTLNLEYTSRFGYNLFYEESNWEIPNYCSQFPSNNIFTIKSPAQGPSHSNPQSVASQYFHMHFVGIPSKIFCWLSQVFKFSRVLPKILFLFQDQNF